MKVNLIRFIASFLVMIGLSSCIIVQINNPSLWNLINFLFFNLVGVSLLYFGLESGVKK